MYVETSLSPLSKPQLRKLHLGKPVRVRYGSAIKVQVMPAQHKKLMKAHMMGKGMVLSVPMMGGASFAEKAQPYLVNKTVSPIKQALAEKAVEKIEGLGMLPTSNADLKSLKRSIKNPKESSKNLEKNLVKVSKAVKKEMKEPMSFVSHLARGEPYVLPDGTAPLSVKAIKRGKPLGGKGAVNRRKKAGLWLKGIEKVYDSIAKRAKPVAKPIGEALGQRAAEYIREYDNPQLQYKGYLDMFQEEVPQTLKALRGEPVVAQPYFPPVPENVVMAEEIDDEKPYEPVQYYIGTGAKKGKKGSAEMKAKMAALRAKKGKPKSAPKAKAAPKSAKPAKGSAEMKAKMAALRAKKKGGALYPAGY
jgi:hypothetical protein